MKVIFFLKKSLNSHCNQHYRKTISKRPKTEWSKEGLKARVSKGKLGELSAHAEGVGCRVGWGTGSCSACSPSTFRTHRRDCTHSHLPTPSPGCLVLLSSWKMSLLSQEGSAPQTQDFNVYCCCRDSITPSLWCVLAYCLKKEPHILYHKETFIELSNFSYREGIQRSSRSPSFTAKECQTPRSGIT